MTDTELSSLEAAAKAATPGPWRIDPRNCEIVISFRGDIAEAMNLSNAGNDAVFIATANPTAILELIAELRQVKAERDWLAYKIAIDGVSCPVEPNVCAGICEDHVSCWLKAAKEATCQKN